jgi:hypothetical protein
LAARIDGVAQLTNALERIRKAGVERVGPVLESAAQIIMDRSKQIVPVVTSNLRASGRVLPPRYTSGLVTQIMGYGGTGLGPPFPDAFYAVLIHDGAPGQGGARDPARRQYLSRPFNEWTRGAEAWLAKEIQAAIEGEASRPGLGGRLRVRPRGGLFGPPSRPLGFGVGLTGRVGGP